MVRRNVRMLVVGCALALLAGIMLVMTLVNSGPEGGLRPGQTVRDPSEIPPMQSPSSKVDEPIRNVDDRRP